MASRRKPITYAPFFFYLLLVSTQFIAARKTPKIKGPIKTVVVVVMENRSFDHIFGWLKSTRPNIDGLNGNESNPISVSQPGTARVPVSNDAFFIDSDPGHSFQAIREQIFGSNESSENPAPMNGFAQQAESMGEGMARTVMSGFKPDVRSSGIGRKSLLRSCSSCFTVDPWALEDGTLQPKVSCALPYPPVSLARKVGAEFLGTFILIFAGTATAIVNQKTQGSESLLGLAASTGLAVMIVILSTGHISGAHLNPSVTIAFAALCTLGGLHLWVRVLAHKNQKEEKE